jgi:hypothetical protein
MSLLKDRRVVLAAGGAAALLAGLGIAVLIMARDHGSKAAPPASKGGLVVEMSAVDDGPATSGRQLRCFVSGQFVGMATLAQCAQKNGVSTQGLDVGLDADGVLTAADGAGLMLTPLPPTAEGVADPGAAESVVDAADPSVASSPPGVCLRHASGEWRKVADDLDLTACVQTLFNGRCEKPGGASYGRWADQTLRLVPGRVEASTDNKSFRILVEQIMPGCQLP